ncbi:MAG: 8-amino-7-oxononanoate synthase [Rhodothalassiaceae bacterium]
MNSRTHLQTRLLPADFARRKLAELAERGILRRLATSRRGPAQEVIRDGRRLIAFCDNDYLGLTQDPRVKTAARAALETYGTGAGASRLITGNLPIHEALEERLAAFKGHEAAVLFGSGYLANVGAIPVLAGRGDLVLLDALAHACLFAGAQLGGARFCRFRHNDIDDLERLLASRRPAQGRALIVTDGVFSMDGDQAPLGALKALADRHDAWLYVDDAHGLGVLGDGRGTAAEQGVELDLGMGTLSKALASYGGYVSGPKPVIDLIKSRARSLIYTTGLPPAAAAAALAALDIIEAEPARCRRPLEHARRFARRVGLPQPESAVVPLILGTPQKAMAAQKALEEAGFLVVAIRPPTVPEGSARLRFSFTAAHREADVDRLADAVAARDLV